MLVFLVVVAYMAGGIEVDTSFMKIIAGRQAVMQNEPYESFNFFLERVNFHIQVKEL